MGNLAIIDVVFILVILVFVVRCAIRGFVSEVMSMAAIVLGLLASLYFFKIGGAFVCEKYLPENPVISEIIAFIVLFLVVFLIIKILERILKDIIEGIKLGKADRFLGIVFGLIEGIIVVSLVLFVINILPFLDSGKFLGNSFFAKIILPLLTEKNIVVLDTALLPIPRIQGSSFHV